MIHPVLSNIRNLAIYTFFWLILTACWASVSYYYFKLELITAITDSFVYNMSFAVLSIGLWYTIRYSHLERFNVFNRLVHHFGEAFIITIIWQTACYFLLRTLFSDDRQYISQLYATIPLLFAMGLIYYALTLLLYYLVMFYRNLQEKIQNEGELRTLVKETELNMLKSQINPHFLFNSLNSISSLTITNPCKAQEMIIKLSEFLRHSIGHKEEQMVTLKEEIEHIMLYLDIEKVRFGEKLRYDFQINDKCQSFKVPSMILQPLFENAVKHGVYESAEDIVVSFSCRPTPEGMKISLTNNFDPETPPRKGNRMGIKNIVNRLRLIYQRDDLLNVTKSKNVFTVEIILPPPL